MNLRDYDNHIWIKDICSLSSFKNEDGDPVQSTIAIDQKRDTYFVHFVVRKSKTNNTLEDIITPIDNKTWKDVPANQRDIIEAHMGDDDK